MARLLKNPKTKRAEFETGNMIWDSSSEDVYGQLSILYSRVENAVLNVAGAIAYAADGTKLNLGGLFGIVDGDAKLNLGGLAGLVDGEANFNFGGIAGSVRNNAGINLGGMFGLVKGDAGLNVGGAVAYVEENTKLNLGGLAGVVDGDAGVNYGTILCFTSNLENYTLGTLLPAGLSNRLPSFIRDLSLPALSFGALNRTMNIKNSLALGLVNYINDDGSDYVAFAPLNIINKENGKLSYVPFFSSRISLDGVLRHKTQ